LSTPIHFDADVGEQFLRYARMVSARGYVHNTLGNMVVRVPHPDFPHGVAYTKHAGVSLEEMGLSNLVVTDIPTSRLLHGTRTTSIGHNLNREILRLRPDVGAVIHVHDDATIAFLGSGAFDRVRVPSRRSRSSSRTPTPSCWSATASPRSAARCRRPTTG
jgi:ribulose-5-phosphate 4-epimerase/fuculose-1-phosphate aldolase